MLEHDESQFAQALRKKAVLLIRQSTYIQKQENTGSAEIQLQTADVLTRFGWPREQIEIVDARGESGDLGRPRPKFNALLEEVRRGEVGIVALARGDRLGRNDVESSTFLQACADTRTYIAEGGKLYNPASVGDRLILQLFSAFAQFENQARARWLLRSRFAKATKLEYRIPLPTGLIWASPDDPVYRERLRDAGLGHWLDRLAEHRAVSRIDGRAHFILPFPDADVVRAIELAIAWLQETGDPGKVRERINDASSGWPRPGALPAMRARVFDPYAFVKWEALSQHKQWARLREWILNPALYGYYTFRSPRLAQLMLAEEAREYEFQVAHAFPAFGTPDDLAHVHAIYRYKKRGWKRGRYTGPRRHALEMVRCGHRDDLGARCDLKLTPMYVQDGSYTYHSHACKERGHEYGYVEGTIDHEVIHEVLRVWDPESVRKSIESFRADASTALRRRRLLERELAALEAEHDAASSLALKAHMEQDLEEEHHWRMRRKDLDRALQGKRLQLQRAQREEENIRRLTDADAERIRALALDLPELLDRAREVDPDALRQLMRELVRRVYFRRANGFAVELEIEFPTGETVLRRVLTRNFACTQPARLWAHQRLAEGADPATVADELNMAPPRDHHVAWDAERVRVAAYVHEYGGCEDALRDGPYRSTAALAAELGVSQDEVFAAALNNYLGPAKYENGDLYLCPRQEEIHFALPEAARQHVAKTMRWPLEDVATRAALVEETGFSRHTVVRYAEHWSGIARDATGRIYVRRSEVVGAIERAIREELQRSAPEHLSLDPSGWRPLTDVLFSHPHLSRQGILRDFPIVRPGIGYLGSRSIYVWLGEL